MSTEAAVPENFIRPRPGVAKTLGVLNLLISVLLTACISASSIWSFMASRSVVETVERPAPPSSKSAPGTRPIVGTAVESLAAFGLDDPAFVRFAVVDTLTGLLANGLMFATGIGLVNLRSWAARWWTWIAWSKIVRLFLVWGSYILFVAPSLSERMARAFLATAAFPPGKGPQLVQLTGVYAVTNLIFAVSMIVLGSIYPAISLYIVGRPGVRAALGRSNPPEAEPS